MNSHITDMLVASARQFADRPAIIAEDRTLTFQQLDQLATRVAVGLAQSGVGPGQRVTLWLENGWRWVVAYYAVLKLGAVVNPCNSQLTAAEVAFVVNDCGSCLILAPEGKAPGLHAEGARCKSTNIDELLATPIETELAPRSIEAGSPAAIVYTSGTTGRPKGAVLSHHAVMVNTMLTSLAHGRTPSDIVVSALPCVHVYGNFVLNSAILCGMTLVLLTRFEEVRALRAIESHRATMFEGVPTMYLRMLTHPELDRVDLGSLRICTVGGQSLPVARISEVERRFGCPMLELWGMTELAGPAITHFSTAARKPGSIGQPLPLTQVRVIHGEDPSVEVPRGEVGELLVRGPMVMDGYLGDPAATRDTLEADGWLHTGDLVRQDVEGYLYMVDRAKEVIVSGGYEIYPAEVERAIAEHPAVVMVAVAAMQDELKGQIPRAFVVSQPGINCSAQEILEHCRSRLAPYKMPREVTFVPDLPRTSTGKILRRALTSTSG